MKIHRSLNKTYANRRKLLDELKRVENKKSGIDKARQESINKSVAKCNKAIKKRKNDLYAEFAKTKELNKPRVLDKNAMRDYNIISVFDSALTRTIGIDINTVSEDILIVQTYFFDVIQDLILQGFMYKSEKYICFTASAGQIRTKKTVFIKESVWIKHQNTITCGLSVDSINSKGGVNVNKYLAYSALCNSATDVWSDFDITKSIVVEDFETLVNAEVDFIDDATYSVTRKRMDVPITHTDGCGMKLTRKNHMCRLPWVKGLMVHFPFDKFVKEMNAKHPGQNFGVIKDIYGKEHDVIAEGIQYIFTKSQFKMYKYYDSWEEYVEKYQKYNCQAGKCNEEPDRFSFAKLNYQMLQTLSDMTDQELEEISKVSRDKILNLGSDRKTMLKVLGVTDRNAQKDYLQQALEIYPELLHDTYSKEVLKSVKKSLVKEGRAGKISINGMYTFIIPDLYAFSEYLFMGNKNPNGLLEDGEIFCKIFKNEPKLDCLRSPHLYREHAVRNNVYDKEKAKWFTTSGLYTSCKDAISKMLQFDNDGDSSLVCADPIIINAAERNMQGIVPLYYEMRKAEPTIINKDSLYNGLKLAYTCGNIGPISNDITKVWNSDDISLEAIKLLCKSVNETIDFAKTLYKSDPPKDKKALMAKYSNKKSPHFFIYAKDKPINHTELINTSVVNRLNKFIPNPRISFKMAGIQPFDYKVLKKDRSLILSNDDFELIEKYTELDLKKRFFESNPEDTSGESLFVYRHIKDKLLLINSDIDHVTDVLIEYLYQHKNSSYKTTLWSCFGDVIVRNIKTNIAFAENTIVCEACGKRVEKKGNKNTSQKYCEDCSKKIKKETSKQKALKYYHSNKKTLP
jgi:hypothetical protein